MKHKSDLSGFHVGLTPSSLPTSRLEELRHHLRKRDKMALGLMAFKLLPKSDSPLQTRSSKDVGILEAYASTLAIGCQWRSVEALQ